MNKIIIKSFLLIFVLLNSINGIGQSKQFIARQGQASFFSYTTAEDIEATNNQVLSIVDVSTNEIAISMLMNAFVFKKTLMYEHFNQSYIESDLYPKAFFKGKIIDFDVAEKEEQIKMIEGELTIHGVSKEVKIKTKIRKNKKGYFLEGAFNVLVKDFEIKIPPILSKNIAESIFVKFKFEYLSYEE